MKKLTASLPIITIFLIGVVLRFYRLDSNPPAPTWDEVAWGYNAFSLLLTGRDEFGRLLPFDYLESFGDFKPPVYAYLSIIPVALFGLNEFSARFASAFFGSITVVITYFLVKSIFSSSSRKESYALLSALFLALSPWHINLSRAAFEANIASFFLITGIWLFVSGVRNNKWFLSLSVISFVLSMYTFNTSRIVAPLLGLMLVVVFFRDLRKFWRKSLVALSIGCIMFFPLLPFLLSPNAQLRFEEVNIFSDPGPVITANEHIANNNNAWWSQILDNRRVFYAREYVKHYFDNLDPSFLFVKGDGNPKFSTHVVGQMYLFDLPFFVIGLLFLFRKREGRWYLLPLWLIIGIIPAATARETPHALRIETILPVPQILVAYGVSQVIVGMTMIKSLRMRHIKNAALSVGALFLVLNVSYYLHDYYTHYPKSFSGEWQYGYADAFLYTESKKGEYDKVLFTMDLGRPYAYYLFYSKMPPGDFLKDSKIKRDNFGFVSVERVGKYYFQRDLPISTPPGEKILYVNTPQKVPGNAVILKKFLQLNGEPSLVAYWMH